MLTCEQRDVVMWVPGWHEAVVKMELIVGSLTCSRQQREREYSEQMGDNCCCHDCCQPGMVHVHGKRRCRFRLTRHEMWMLIKCKAGTANNDTVFVPLASICQHRALTI